jgi:hypothetical protein
MLGANWRDDELQWIVNTKADKRQRVYPCHFVPGQTTTEKGDKGFDPCLLFCPPWFEAFTSRDAYGPCPTGQV